MRVCTIIQARMGSSRLPGKVLLDLGGETVLARVVDRVRRAKLTGEVVVATTTKAADDAIVGECQRLSVDVFRGKESDVLDRYYHAAKLHGAEVVVRITSDCPLIEPEITDRVIQVFLDRNADYCSNTLERTYPRGLDTEVMTWSVIKRCWQEAHSPYQRAHVTPYVYENPELFDMVSVVGDVDLSHHRWTLDTVEDLLFIRAVYERMGDVDFRWRDTLRLLQCEPELAAVNQHIQQKALQEG